MSTLYLVATPIGNFRGFLSRARETMASVDFIAAEDTRVTKKLLTALDLPMKPLISYYEHNRPAARRRNPRAPARRGKLRACDRRRHPSGFRPGEDLVALCRTWCAGDSRPGCCAAVCALAASGLPTGRWCFEGFLSVNKKARREHLDALRGETRTMIFYEAPHKLQRFPTCVPHSAATTDTLSREITKLREETPRFTLEEAEAYFAETAPRGEFVLILKPQTKSKPKPKTSA